MKKFLITIAIFTISFIWFTSAYIEDKVFCAITKNSIIVTIEKENNYKCDEYLSVLAKSINTEYQNILSIQELIKQWHDVDFWKEIMDEKRTLIKQMLNIKEQIEIAVAEFDANMFSKTKEYLIYVTATDRTIYKKALKSLEDIEKNWLYIKYNTRKIMDQIKESIVAIDTINSTDDFDTLLKNFNKYIYLKNKIIWK